MKVTKAKVDYTEVVVEMDANSAKTALADFIRIAKNVDARPEDIEFVLADDANAEAAVIGIKATVLKRGRVQKNGHAKKEVTTHTVQTAKPEGTDDDGFPDADGDKVTKKTTQKAPGKKVTKEKAGKKTAKTKKVDKSVMDEIDEPDE